MPAPHLLYQLLACSSLSVRLLLAPFSIRATRAVQGMVLKLSLYFISGCLPSPLLLCISLYFSKSKSHPAQVIIIRTSHDPISQLLHTITAPLRYPLLSTINLPSNNTGLCTIHTTINKITYYYHVFYLKQHTRHSLHIYSIMTCILL